VKEDQQPITGCGVGDIAQWVFLCGDPDRVPKIAADWEEGREVCRVREYVIHTGVRNGVLLSAASTGIGGASTAILMEELAKLGAHTFIRVGNSGALASEVVLGDYVITSAAIRDEGTSRSYILSGYPAVAHPEVTMALVQSAREGGHRHHVGITWSTDGFYSRNKMLDEGGKPVSMSYEGYSQSWMNALLSDMRAARALNIEMESAVILTLANLFGLRAGCICTVSDRTPWPGPGQDMIALDKNIQGAIEVATQAMLRLARAR